MLISGRGLGHTTGTLDKLEAIPGFRTDLPLADFRRIVDEVGSLFVPNLDWSEQPLSLRQLVTLIDESHGTTGYTGLVNPVLDAVFPEIESRDRDSRETAGDRRARVDAVEVQDVRNVRPTEDGGFEGLTKKEVLGLSREQEKLERSLGVELFHCDSRRFDSIGVAGVNLGPGTAAQAHQPNEYTELDHVTEGYAIFERFFRPNPDSPFS